MEATSIKNITTREIVPGFYGKYYHAQQMTIGWLDAKAGYVVPIHSHMHEQVSYVEEGKLLFVIDGKEILLEAGMILTIPPNVPHGATAVTDCKLIDVFSPVREDYK